MDAAGTDGPLMIGDGAMLLGDHGGNEGDWGTEGPADDGFIDALRDEAAYWGKTIGTKYGEPFACREPLGVKSMQEFV